jgi:hypothetical protein
MTNSTRTVLSASAAVALIALLAGCAAETATAPTPSGDPSEPSATAEPVDPASALVADYLEAISLGNPAGAWELLSPETQETYNDSAETYAEYAPTNETVSRDDAEVLATATATVTPGPENGFQLVSAQSGDVADAWVVRETGDGLRIDDPGLPPTGERPYTWTNPGDDGYDVTSSPTIYFQKFYGEGGETDLIAGPPDAIVGYADGVEVPVEREASSGAGANFVAFVELDATVLTLVWAPEPGNKLWQSSTVTLD